MISFLTFLLGVGIGVTLPATITAIKGALDA